MKKINIPKDKLKELYEDKNLSTYSISKIYNCDPTVIQKRLKEYKLKTRYPKKGIPISKKELKKLYIKKKLSTYKIAKIYHCGSRTIYGKLKKYGIQPRPLKKIPISKKELFHMYHKQKLSYSEIAKKFSCSASIIFDKMKKYGISPRNPSEANTIYPKKNFSGNLIEKAYLIGFRLGDLYVFKKCNLIQIKTNTTKIEQVELVKKLFNKYGRFYIKKYKNNFFNLEGSLNNSFSFLIPKQDEINKWILKNNKYFLAFLAGYIDAEGNIGVYSNRARVRIGSYDKNLLRQIHKKLLEIGIYNIYKLETLAGTNNQNQDFWRISINQKTNIINLFNLIKPYLKHSKRCEDLKIAEKNIISRNKK